MGQDQLEEVLKGKNKGSGFNDVGRMVVGRGWCTGMILAEELKHKESSEKDSFGI